MSASESVQAKKSNVPTNQTLAESPIGQAALSQRLRSTYFKLISTSWLLSALLHVLVLLSVGRIFLPLLPPPPVRELVMGVATEEIDSLEDISELLMEVEVLDTVESTSADLLLETEVTVDEPQPSLPTDVVPVDTEPMMSLADTISDMAAPSTTASPPSVSARSGMSASDLRHSGGNAGSEAAVQESLIWLARHQLPTGGWSLRHEQVPGCDCRNSGVADQAPYDAPFGATGLALLPFLGAGQTHVSGQHQQLVKAGLAYLVENIEMEGTRGKLYDRGNYYSHGICTIVLCEAYAMTRDPSLAAPAQALINQIVYAQDPVGGGWRYTDRQPGDTSVTGWQFMALKSAHLAGLRFPPEVIEKANRFLDTMAVDAGAYAAEACFVVDFNPTQVTVEVRPQNEAAYRVAYVGLDTSKANLRVGQPIAANSLIAPYAADQLTHSDGWKYRYALATDMKDQKIIAPRKPTAAMSAVGLLCRMYYGWEEEDPVLQRGLQFLGQHGPSVESPDMYYNYYATQVMRHQSDAVRWSEWNAQLRDFLIASQESSGHERGSWHFGDNHHGDAHGGRLYVTALASMILEVYYRHLPLYRDSAAESFLD